jgi:hypothetical protein
MEGGSHIGEVDNYGNTALIIASGSGHLKTVIWLLREGGSHVGETGNSGSTALILAAQSGHLETVVWLLKEGGSHIGEANCHGCTAMLNAAHFGRLETVTWLLEHGGANIKDKTKSGTMVWYMLRPHLTNVADDTDEDDDDDVQRADDNHATAVITLLRVMLLQDAFPWWLTAQLSPEHAEVVQEGARLRVRLPAYLTQRRALLDAHYPLIAPLQDLVHGYEVPTTTDELWATGLGAARQGAARPRADDGTAAISQRRSDRLRQKRE